MASPGEIVILFTIAKIILFLYQVVNTPKYLKLKLPIGHIPSPSTKKQQNMSSGKTRPQEGMPFPGRDAARKPSGAAAESFLFFGGNCVWYVFFLT